MRPTFHLVPAEAWASARGELETGGVYAHPSLASEGFIHCTDGEDELGQTFDRYYAGDARGFVALTVDLDALDVPWRFDVAGSPYPHIYGPIPRVAVIAESRVDRDPEGRFVGLTKA